MDAQNLIYTLLLPSMTHKIIAANLRCMLHFIEIYYWFFIRFNRKVKMIKSLMIHRTMRQSLIS